MGSNEQHPPPPSSAVALPSLDEMERRLTTPRGLLMHRMLCLGMSIPSSSYDDHDGDGDDGDAGRSGCRARDDDHRRTRDNEEQEEYDDDEIVIDASDDDYDDVDVDGAKLGGVTGGLPTILLSLLEVAFESWSGLHETSIASSSLPSSQQQRHESPPISSTTKAMRLSDTNEYSILLRTLVLLSNAAGSDPTLGEEIALGRGRRGRTLATVRSLLIGRVGELLAALVGGEVDEEDDADALADLQDAVFGIYPPSSSMPSSSSSSLLQASSPCMPLADEELRRRLPLVYDLTMPASHRRRRRGGDDDGEAHRPRRDHPRPRRRWSASTKTTTTTTTTTSMEIYIGQVVTRRQTEQADVGYVMWPSAIALSRYLVANPHRIVGGGGGSATGYPPSVILELGAGCGLVGIVAARLILAHRRRGEETRDDDDDGDDDGDGDGDGDVEGEKQRRHGERRRDPAAAIVVITDFNEMVLENIARNVELNGVSSVARVSRLDFYEQSGDCRSGRWIAGEGGTTGAGGCADGGGGEPSSGDDGRGRPPAADVVLAADVICRPEDAVAASRTIYDALRPGGVALVVLGNAEHRYGVEIFPGECEMRGLKVTSTDVADMMLHDGGRGLPPGGGDSMMETAAGYVDGMRMTFFEITKMM